MNERSWLWTLGIVLLALWLHDWLSKHGRLARAASGFRASHWQNLRPPNGDKPVAVGLAPGPLGTVPKVDDGSSGKGCCCS
jgi:hypothetical protein